MDHLKNTHILVTGGGAPGAVGIIKALNRAGYHNISCSDVNKKVAGSILANDSFQLPYGTDPDYTDILLKECKTRDIDLILPITTKELLAVSRIKSKLADVGCNTVVSPIESLKISNDKGALYTHLKDSGITVPKHRIVQNIEEFENALEAFDQGEAFTFKPCVSNGSRGFRIIDPSIDEFDLWLNQKPNNAYVTKEEALSILKKGPMPPLLFSEYLEGEEYSVDCLIHKGEIKLIIPRKRININNGISVEGLIENNKTVIDYCTQILESLELDGPIGIQVKYKGNQPLILEINPRLQGSSTSCIGAGINLPQLAIENALGKQPNKTQNDIKWGTHFVRHYEEIYYK
ncbi:MAG: ATP-grasp domain-containing protein [Bacteroidia bacterium]